MPCCARSSASCSSRRRTGNAGTLLSHRRLLLNHSDIVSFLWGVADLIRDSFKRGKYQEVILPPTVLRRLDCVLAPTKEAVLRRQAKLRARGLEDLHRQLCMASGFAFYNTSRYDFETLLADAPRPRVRVYPREAVVAEKLHAMVVLGERNSRYKDFYVPAPILKSLRIW